MNKLKKLEHIKVYDIITGVELISNPFIFYENLNVDRKFRIDFGNALEASLKLLPKSQQPDSFVYASGNSKSRPGGGDFRLDDEEEVRSRFSYCPYHAFQFLRKTSQNGVSLGNIRVCRYDSSRGIEDLDLSNLPNSSLESILGFQVFVFHEHDEVIARFYPHFKEFQKREFETRLQRKKIELKSEDDVTHLDIFSKEYEKRLMSRELFERFFRLPIATTAEILQEKKEKKVNAISLSQMHIHILYERISLAAVYLA